MSRIADLAAAATPGPWQHVGQVLGAGKHRIGDTQDVCCFGHSGQECTDEEMETWALADAAYIAAASPDVVLAMDRVVEAARATMGHRGTDGHASYSSKVDALRTALADLDRLTGGDE